jgi:hypothetical protein
LKNQNKVLQISEKGAALSLFGFVASIPVSITATQGFFILGMLFWGVKILFEFRISNKEYRIRNMDGLKLAILLFFIAGIIASLNSLNPGESFFELRDFGFLFIIFFVSNHIRDEKHLKKLLRLLIGIYGLLRSTTQKGKKGGFFSPAGSYSPLPLSLHIPVEHGSGSLLLLWSSWVFR